MEYRIVDVAVPVPLNRSFHYLITPEMAEGLQAGSILQVPFGKRQTYGFVLGFPEQGGVPEDKLREALEILAAAPVFDEATLKFLRWVADYYCHPLGEVLAAAAPRNCWKLTPRQRQNAEKLASDPEFLASMGLVAPAQSPPVLTEEQEFALGRILDAEDERPVLLHGVTGSGKTEIYIRAIEEQLRRDKAAIVLVPEIALTPQLLGRFAARFPGLVAVLHSDLTPRERYIQWERLRTGAARVVVGARSAIFAPVRDLGLIVVDEEHETSYKQEDSLRYHGRDLAVLRGHFSGAKVILGSATPSLESYWNAKRDRYTYVTLLKRVQDRPMPTTRLVDLKEAACVRQDLPWLSHELFLRIKRVLDQGQQAMIYLNRLGYAHFLFCKDCGHTWRCLNCDVSLTFYRASRQLKCHCCGYIAPAPSACEECEGTQLETIGLGTEQVEATFRELLPQARILRMDRSVVKNRKDLEEVLAHIANREADIVVGTQMIAKGHDFPGIALVGILLADASLNFPDFRANERTFQILTQVSGRAGRAGIPGEVVVQTLNPGHPVLVAATENRTYDFYRMELEQRRHFQYPPFTRTAMLRFQHRNAMKVQQFAETVCELIRKYRKDWNFDCQVLGPVEAPIAKMKNVYRWNCLLKGEKITDLHKAVELAQQFHSHQKSLVQFAVDVDPVNSL